MQNQSKGVIWLLVSVLGFGAEAILVKWAYGSGLSPLTVVVFRTVIASLVLSPIWMAGLRNSHLGPRSLLAMSGVGALNAGAITGIMWSLKYVPASVTVVCLYIYPVVVNALSRPVLGEKFTWVKFLGLVGALMGVLLVAGSPGARPDLLGVVFALGAALLNGVSMVLVKRFFLHIPAMTSASGILLTSTVLFAAIGSFAGVSVPTGSTQWAVLVGLGLLCTALPLVALYSGLALLEASRAAIISASEPVVTAVLAFILLGEKLSPVQLVGAAFVVASAAIQVERKSKRRPEGGASHA